MKKMMNLIALLMFVTTASQAQKLSTNKVPNTVKLAFSKSHPNLSKVTWSKENANFEAEFISNERQTSEVYAANGAFIESEVALKIAELPTAVKLKLKGLKIAEAAKITKADGTVSYEAEVNGKDLLFDANGKPLKI